MRPVQSSALLILSVVAGCSQHHSVSIAVQPPVPIQRTLFETPPLPVPIQRTLDAAALYDTGTALACIEAGHRV